MQIEIVKRLVERFWYTLDFGPALPDGVRVADCAVQGEMAKSVLADSGHCDVVEDGRAVRVMVEKNDAAGDYPLVLLVTLSDGQVFVQDVVVRASDGVAKAGGDVEGGTWITMEGGRPLFIADGETAAQALGRATGGTVGDKPAYTPTQSQRIYVEQIEERITQWGDAAERGARVSGIVGNMKGMSERFMQMSVEASAGDHKDQADALLRASESAREAFKEVKGGTIGSTKRAAPHIRAIKEHLTRGGVFAAARPIRKSPAREYAGHFAQPTNAAHADAYAVRAYGSGPDDKRVFRAKTAGLPVATCPECDADAQGERREVTVKELALSRNALSRGKMSRMASALRDGVREGEDFAAIKVAELHDGEGEGPRYAVLPGQGNHRVAHLMLSRKAGTVPVMVVPRKGVAKWDPDQPRDEGGRFGEGGGGGAEEPVVVANPGKLGPGWKTYAIPPQSKAPSASKTPSADEQRAAFRQKIGDAARAEFGTDKPSREQVQSRAQDQKAKYGKSASVWVWDPSSGGAMPGTVDRDAKSETYERSGQREDRQYVVNVPDLDKGGTRPVTAYHGDIAPRGVKKQLSTSTPSKGAEWTPIDMAGRRARRRENVARKRKKTLTR